MKRISVLLMAVLLLSCSRAARFAELPIGVFDSGTGGLTVLERILTLDNYSNPDGSLSYDFKYGRETGSGEVSTVVEHF